VQQSSVNGSILTINCSATDISGDGRETLGPMRPNVVSLYHARRRAEQMHVTINALVISDEGDDLAGYFAKKVIIGDNAFAMDITNLADFSAAIRKKLIKELSYEALTSGVTVAFATEQRSFLTTSVPFVTYPMLSLMNRNELADPTSPSTLATRQGSIRPQM
jgi:Protein of unknown function (DUF1194)